MTEIKRTAAQIRAYCEAATEEAWGYYGNEVATQGAFEAAPGLSVGSVEHTEPIARFSGYLMPVRANADFAISARTDLPRVLDAAVALREALEYCWCVMRTVPSGITKVYRETAWLADSPEAPLSPDGESGEESET